MRFSTDSDRLEAFSDGVLAVIITVMVLEIRPPATNSLSALLAAVPSIGLYALSFVFIGIYWNNHHHMLRATKGIDGAAMWANLHLLFWLSLVPFATEWLGHNPSAAAPTAFYGVILLCDAIAYTVLQRMLVRLNAGTAFEAAVSDDRKGKLSVALYVIAIGLAFVNTIVSDAILIFVAILWFVPDRRFEPLIGRRSGEEN